MSSLQKFPHGVKTEEESVVRKKRQKESEGRMAALWGGHITSHRGPGSKDQVSAVYQQSIHGGRLAPLTITPQHLAIPTQETWGHFPPFREFRHTPAASHAPPQPIEEAARAPWHTYNKLKRRSEFWEKGIFTNTVQVLLRRKQKWFWFTLFWSYM